MKSCRKTDPKIYADGYMTVFLALSLLVLLSLILTLVEGARINVIRMRTETAGNTAVRSVLGEFHRELLRQYDLYFVDTSYGTGSASAERVQQHLQTYMEKNLQPGGADFAGTQLQSLTVDAARFAADDRAAALREQVYAYMAADPAGSVIADILVSADRWKGLEISGREWTAETEKSREDLKQALRDRREDQKQENEEKEEREEEVTAKEYEAASDEPSEAENMVDRMGSFQLLPVLRQVFGDVSGLSDRQVETENVLSARKVHLGTGMTAVNSHKYPPADEILFDRYIYEKTGSCVNPSEDGQLRYQTEYILCGKGSDRENLEGTAARLILIREASNCAYLFTDESRMGQVRAVAAAASLLLLSPELEEPASYAIALAWSYLESVQDVRTLMKGGKVPVFKTGDSWKTRLYELLTPLTAVRDRDSGEGLDYRAYLQGLLLLSGSSVKTQRTMDVMEMDLRRITGNSGFRMDLCLDEFNMNAGAKACGTEFLFSGSSGYN